MQQDKMIERLDSMEKRLKEIDDLLCQDDIVSNISKMTELNKERANLEEPVEKYQEYKKMLQELLASKEDRTKDNKYHNKKMCSSF